VFDNLREEDIWQYRYPADADLAAVGVVGIYLGNYVRWDPKAQNEAMIRTHDFHTGNRSRTFDTYEHVDCFNYLDLHDVLKLHKHGYSKVTDHACREIRHGRMTRAQGQDVVRLYEQRPVEHADLFRQWLGVSESGLQFLLDQQRNPGYWNQVDSKSWAFAGWSLLRDGPTGRPEETGTRAVREMDFVCNDRIDRAGDRRYVTIGKGYPS
jgi:hypothetical protein